jgi:3-hydroxybutyryl-CoA dehydrogenase
MGAGIAQVAASAGHKVVVYDNNLQALDKAKIDLANTLKKLVEKQKLTDEKVRSIIANTQFANDLNEFKNCGLVIEAIIENIDVKQKLFSDLETIVSADCILATNTSSLSIASIASACKKAERVIGIHFFNPAPIMPLVEIIPGIMTDASVTENSKKIIDSWGKVTVLTKDTPGFIVNRVARSFYGESIRIFEEGMADFATIDWALKTYGGFKMGPFELMDFIGNDINFKVTESVWTQFFFEPRLKPSLTQKRLYEAKLFGKKSGRGYYNYADGIVLPQPKQDEELGKYIFNRVICMLINEAIDSLYLQLASKEDLDLAMTKGVNYPKGLLKWADEIGLKNVYTSLDVLYELYNEDRYRPSILLKMMVRDDKKFY